MKKYLLSVLTLLIVFAGYAQTTVSFATGGTPVYAAPWTLGGSAAVSGANIQLTPPSGSQSGRIYTSTPITLTGCGSFTAEFEFQVIPSSSAFAVADGIAFWILSPLSGFVGGGGIGLPTNPNGLVLILDNYNNDGVANDPLISLYGYPTGFTGTYVEGVATNRLGALSNQYFVWDGGWHHVKVTYAGGQVKLYLNHSATPSITGTFAITSTSLYFGFCASTGGAWSTQSIRNCIITYDNASPITGPDVVCTSTTGVYTDSTAGGTWSSSNTAVGTISSTGVLTPLTAGTTTISYAYGSGPCYATKVVTVNTTTLPSIGGPNPLCASTMGTYTNSVTGGTWSSSNPLIGTINASTGELSPTRAGSTTITYTAPMGCYRTIDVTLDPAPPALTITPDPASVCDGASLALTATGASAYHMFPPQSFENGCPTTPGVPVDGWNYAGAAGVTATWYHELGSTAVNPTIGSAVSGNNVANFHARSLTAGSYGYLYSPTFSMTGVSSAQFSIWVYRDATTAYNTATYNTEYLYVYLYGSSGGSTWVGTIPRRTGLGITGSFSGTSTPASSGWYQYTYTLPSGFGGTANYFYIYGFSQNGNNIYVDSITLTGTLAAPTWTPSTYLFTDATLSTAYTGTALNPVYVHPTGITTPTNITYTATISNGPCSSSGTRVVTMNPNPGAITGTTTICTSSTVTLSSSTSGGSWSSSNTTVATIGSSTGILSGSTPGTTSITYSFGSCYVTTTVTVVSSPGAITGIPTACLGATTTLSNATAGGSWSSSNTTVGTVDPSTGVVTGLSLGTTTITYGIATCYSTLTVTVNPYPTAITGTFGVCIGATTTLSSTPGGGFWFTSAPAVASVGVTTGIVTGTGVGTATITYRVGGCAVTTTVNVVSTPGPIAGTLTTCVGSTTTLTHAVSGGTWTSSDITKATVGSSSGIVTGTGVGTARITYTVGTGCYATAVVTVGATPTAPTGTLAICEGGTTTLSHSTPGGTWSCSCGGSISVGLGTGVVTTTTGSGGSTCTITYTLPTGCLATAVLTVNSNPGAISGTLSLCSGQSATLTSATPGVTWSSSTPAVATISSSGTWTGVAAGTATIICGASGCTTSTVVTVNAAPSAITGTLTICEGSSSVLSSSPAGGVWTCCAGNTISGTGLFTGLVAGTCGVTYTSAAGCSRTTVATVNPNPTAILGPTGMCVGATGVYTCSTTGIVWSVTPPSVLTLLSPGFVAGASAGVGTVVATVTATGCSASIAVTVNAAPGAIGGVLNVCAGGTTTLTNSASGGTWSYVAGTGTATIDPVTGVLSAGTPGTGTVTYSLGSSCVTSTTVTINALPGIITGPATVCAGVTTNYTCTPAGGTWSVGAPATISSAGAFSSATAGTYTIVYTLPTGCSRSTTVTVNALPGVISGATSVCVGSCTTLTSTPAGGTWSASNGNVTVTAGTGNVCGAFAGTSVVSYTLLGCSRTQTMLINSLPTGMSPSSVQVCEGSTLSLTGSPAGGTWSSSNTAVGTISTGGGLLGGISPGTTSITYTLPSGCAMSAVATVNGLPGTIGGVLSACVGQCTTLNSTPATGTWSVSAGTGTATIGSSSGVLCGSTAGTVSVSYTFATGCRRIAVATVNGLPGAITGATNVCVSSTTTLSCAPAGGTWSMACATGTIGATSGVVTGLSPGTCTVTYTAGAGCYSTQVVTTNPLPAPITGTATTCVGQCTTLSTTSIGGVWSSSTTAVGTIGASTGTFCGIAAGTSIVSYTLPTGCRTTQIATVYALPSAIGGSLQVCAGSTGMLTTSTPGGTWGMSCATIATVDASTGAVTGVAAGTCEVTYTLGTGCSVTAIVTVNSIPAPISGTLQICQGQTTTLTDATIPGTWSSAAVGVATVSATGGVVYGVTPGTATISYTGANTCSNSAIVTVYALPSAITGPSPMWVCENANITLASSPSGGVWSSPDANVSVSSISGAVTGLTAGTATISYTQGIGCVQTTVVTVQAQPAAITGNLNVCIGFTQLLSTTSTTGTWSSSNTAVAPVDPTGLVSGLVLGTANIRYTLPVTGCYREVQATVQPLPSTIIGPSGFCNLSTAMYTSSPSGGTWSSADTSILTTDSVSGAATGVNVDTTDIIYTLPTGCSTSKSVFLILAPYPITGPHDMCLGQSRTLTNVISGGTWTSSNPLICSVNPATGDVTGNSLGVATITYVLSTGCASTYDVTVNPIPTGIVGPLQVCESYSVTMSNTTPGGSWTSSNPLLADIGSSSGIVTATGTSGVVTLTYTLGTGCNASRDLTVNPLPLPISGPTQVCEGVTVSEMSGPAGGLWSSSAGNIYIDALSGDATGVFVGTSTISYTLATGCYRTQDMTVNPLPSGISGATDICLLDQTTLYCPTPGGTWISSDITIATVTPTPPTSCIVTGVGAGTVVISYVLPTGCIATYPMTINNNPAPISGSTTVCAGFATNLYSGPSGGVWSQEPSSMPYGTINATTGVVSGIMAGYIPVTYTLGTGCRAVDTVEVITLPAVIGGIPSVCVNDSTILSCPVAGGTWSSSNTARATVNPLTGAVTGVSPGTAVITYQVGTGCFNVHTVTVNPLPAPITGTFVVCEQSSTILSSAAPGGAWISGNTAVGTVFGPVGPTFGSTTFTGVSAGTTTITYMLFTGCKTTVEMTVNSTPAPITGNPHICMGASNVFSSTSTGGIWSSSNPAIATIGATSGIATSVSLGVVTISYTYPGTGCTSTRVVTVQPLPAVFNVTGGGNFCAGGSGVHVNLSGSQPGVSYQLYYGTSATGFLAGSGFALDFGLHTAAGTYTVQATNVTSGCQRNMSGAATIVVNPLVTPLVNIATTPTDSVCEGETVAMTAMPTFGGTAPAYTWKVNGVFVSTADNYSYIPANGDVVTVTMTSNYTCVATTAATGTQLLTVMPSATPVAGVITTPGDTVCQYNPVTFNAAPVYGGTAPTYTWLVNGTTAAFGTSFTYVPTDGDIVNLQMTSNYRCRAANTVLSGDVTMSVDSMRLPTVTVTPEPGSIVAAGKPVTMHAWPSDAGPNPSFQWKVNGILVPGATSDTYTAVFHDYDSISVTVISSGVCHNIGTSDWFRIDMAPLGTHQTAVAASQLRLVPNPNKGTFTISGNLASGVNEDVHIEITDMLGQVVFRGNLVAKHGRVNNRITLENNLANGMYMLTLRTDTEQKVFHFVLEQ
ncbi:MAG: T9SS type A sorting domain-containing protein [Taibaiella sp.]|nr:T9SS type A sorting domain-containing protein [Taibaiella sp.]